jgi:hypothetical protein
MSTARLLAVLGLISVAAAGFFFAGDVGAQQTRGIVKPRIEDTVHVSIYADNWFALFVNGRLVAVDPIEFLPHNVVTIDLLPQYPMSIAVLAKDNADPVTGLEYGDQIGDGGFILRMSDGTATSAKWKAKSFFSAPGVPGKPERREEIPPNWFAVDFDDSNWAAATVYSPADVRPPPTFRAADFSGAEFVWSGDLARDNTVILRAKVERPGWRPLWNTTPDLDLREAPFR